MLKSRRNLTALAFLAPNLSGFLIFMLVPVVAALGLSLFQWDIFHPPRFVWFSNFIELLGWGFDKEGDFQWNDPLFWQYLGNTLFIMLANISCATFVSGGRCW